MHVTDITALEIALRFLSAATLTLAAIFIAGAFLGKTPPRPHPVWRYVGAVTAVAAVYRWAIVLLIRPELVPEEWQFVIDPWVLPAGQAIWTLVGISIIMLLLVGIRRRK